MKARLILNILILLVVTVPLVSVPCYPHEGNTFATKISKVKWMMISQSRENLFGTTEGGAITGKVYADNSDDEGEPIREAWVVATLSPDGEPVGWALSGWNGTYLIAGLPSGEYFLQASSPGFIPEFFDDAIEPREATPVEVSDEGTVDDIDFHLAHHGQHHGEGSISGFVIDDDSGDAIEGAHVLAVTLTTDDPDSLFWMGEAITGSGGTYKIDGLISGDYIVSVSAYQYLPEYYDDVYTFEEATPVRVDEPRNTSRIDFGLSQIESGRGSISGVVLAETDSTIIEDAYVSAYSPVYSFLPDVVRVKSDGTYRIEGLMSGDYFVVARAPNYHAEWYDNVKTEDEATFVPVTSPDETPGIDFYLGHLGSISGLVTSEADGTPIAEALVCAVPVGDTVYIDPDVTNPNFIEPGFAPTVWFRCAVTDSNGAFELKGLAAGEYFVGVWALGFLNEWYDNIRNFEEAHAVTVLESQTTPDIDFALSTGGSISGRVVVASDGHPISNGHVCAIPLADSTWIPGGPIGPDETFWPDRWACGTTDDEGYYTVTGLVTGEYYVHVWAEGFLPEWYDGVHFRQDATPVAVTEPEETSGINFALGTGGSISGQVRSEVDDRPIPDVTVCVFSVRDSLWFQEGNIWPGYDELLGPDIFHCVRTDGEGRYEIGRLPTGEYYVVAWMEDFLPEWFDDAPGWKEATPVAVVDPEQTPDIDFRLSTGGSISGHVLSGSQGSPVFATVCAFQMNGTPSGEIGSFGTTHCTETDEHGRYVLTGLKSGTYHVVAHARGYEEQWYDHADTQIDATPVEVVVPEETAGINFTLKAWGGEGAISGRVVDEGDGHPIARALVEARRGDGWWTGIALTQDDGTYVIPNLPSGNYFVSVRAEGYFHEFYDNVRNAKDATYVEVAGPGSTPDINFELTKHRQQGSEGGIAGYVTAVSPESDTLTVAEAFVFAFSVQQNSISDRNDAAGMAVADERGYYVIENLPQGQYVVMCFASGFIGELYDDVLNPKDATLVRVLPPDVTPGIDFELSAVAWEGGGSISGTIYEADGATPVSNVWVYALDRNSRPVAWDQTGPNGTYVLSGLAPGQYTVQASEVANGVARSTYWAGSDSDGVDTFEESEPVDVGPTVFSGVDLVMRESTLTGVDDDTAPDVIPEGFALEQNRPNPFNPTTDIRYAVVSQQSQGHVSLKVYNLLGQEVRTLVDELQESGHYTVTWDGRDNTGGRVASGYYFCRLQAGTYAATIKMILMK
ncbi:MAG: carboxypeptidase regulatory-like domain-containing protein [Gemmatimonadota bacterium]|nr:MAG: carboxypeptidase regulatory-like domain-containing protein [Gemmatimonadota bacterium]